MLVHLRMNFFSINIYKIIARSAKITCFGDWKLKMLERGREGGLQGLLSCLFKSGIRENILLDFFIMQEIWYAIVLVTVYNQRIIFWPSLTKMSSTKQNKFVFPSNHVTSRNSRNSNHNNNSKMTIVLMRRSKVLAVTPCLK